MISESYEEFQVVKVVEGSLKNSNQHQVVLDINYEGQAGLERIQTWRKQLRDFFSSESKSEELAALSVKVKGWHFYYDGTSRAGHKEAALRALDFYAAYPEEEASVSIVHARQLPEINAREFSVA